MKRIFWSTLVAMTALFTVAAMSVAWADTLNVNDLVTHGNTSVVQGGSGTAEVYLDVTNGTPAGDPNGCNAGGATPVTVTLTSDTPSAIPNPGTVTLTGCGAATAQTKAYSVSASAVVGTFVKISGVASGGKSGGTFTTDFFTVEITAAPVVDTSPPVITKTITGTAGSHGWYTSDVTVVWSVSDPESAVVIDAGCGTESFTAETTGDTSTCSAHSVGGPASDSVVIKLDKTGPSAALAVTAGNLGTNGWYTSNVTVSTSGSDSISGPPTCSADDFQTTDTAGQTFNGSCTNDAGLTTNATSLTVKLDKTGPSANLSVTDGTLGAHGWYTSDVTVSTSGSDSLSSPVTCTGDQSQTAETAGTDFDGSCTNDAGLTTDAGSLNVKLDKTAPSANLSVTAGTLGAHGWYTSNVTVSTNGSDSISSPVTCTGDQSQTTETAGTDFDGSCTNDAGLTTDADSLTVKLDKTGPSANLSVTAGTLGSHGWYTSAVTVSTTGSDSISGPTSCSGDQHQTTDTAGNTFNGSCTNDAGLTTNATSLTVKLDTTGPSAGLAVTAGTLGTNGWYTSDVTVSTSGVDSLSSPVTCDGDQYQTTETAGTVFNGSCTNDAGLKTNAVPLTVKLDKTNPTVSLVGGPADGANYYFGSVPAAPTCSASDALSGLNGSCTVAGYSGLVGIHTVSASVTDNAGNPGSDSRTYTVDSWTLGGFYAPVDKPNTLNVTKGGSTVPLKFEVFAGSTELTDTSVVSTLTKQITCGTGLPTDTVEVTVTGGTSLRYDTTAGQFIYNWQTPKRPGTCWMVTMTTNDGSSIYANFSLK